MNVRAIFRAAKVPEAASPYDTLHLQLFYPSTADAAPDRDRAPFPVVLFFNGLNCEPSLYRWLAVKLAEESLATVLFSWVAQNIPGIVAMTPGVSLRNLAPDVYGTQPTASAVPTILAELEQLQGEEALAGLLDLQNIVLGGHSVGGRVAIESASPQFFPQVKAAFGYGAHTAAGPQIGYPANTILPLPDRLPLLLMGGTRDGVIANSGQIYGAPWETPETPIVRTFEEAIAGGREDSYLLVFEGANHFTLTHPLTAVASTTMLDFAATQSQEMLQGVMGEAIAGFLKVYVCDRPQSRAEFRHLFADNSAIARFAWK